MTKKEIINSKKKFFQWKKILMRLVHLAITLFVTGSLLYKNTELHKELLMQNYVKVSLFVAITYSSIMFYLLTCLTDPGYVEPSDNDCESNSKPDGNSELRLRYCDTCQLVQPIRSRHCEECQRCIKKFDHHCPWLDTCVGEHNHKFFVLFLLTTAITIVWSFIIAWRAFEPSTDWVQWLAVNTIYIVDLHVLFMSFLACFGLLLIHTYFMVTNTTTWEKFSRRNITYLRTIKDDYNPFHEGYCKNVARFCCQCTTIKWEQVYVQFTKTKCGAGVNRSPSAVNVIHQEINLESSE